MIVNSAYMYMGKGVSKLVHLFSNGAPNYAFSALSGSSTINDTGLVMGPYAKCRFSGVPLQDKTKITLNFTNRNYPQSSGFYLYIKTSGLIQKFSVGKSTANQSEVFEIAIPTDVQIENASIEIESQSYCTFTDIVIE